jgi:hypothetical protein
MVYGLVSVIVWITEKLGQIGLKIRKNFRQAKAKQLPGALPVVKNN